MSWTAILLCSSKKSNIGFDIVPLNSFLCLDLNPDMFLSFHKGMLKEDNATTFRMLYYPPLGEAPLPYATRCGEHTDYGTFTLLSQDTEGGLEVLVGTELYCANDFTIKESYLLEYNWVGFINFIMIFYFWKMILFHQISIKLKFFEWVEFIPDCIHWSETLKSWVILLQYLQKRISYL